MKSKNLEVDKYIQGFPKNIQKILKQVRALVKSLAPKAEEALSYGMPGYKLNKKPLVYFAAWKNHLGFYPTPTGLTRFKKELKNFSGAKGSVQFPFEKVPFDLIAKIVKFRVGENLEKYIFKTGKKLKQRV